MLPFTEVQELCGEEHPEELQPFPAQVGRSMEEGVFHLGAGSDTGDIDAEREFFPCGQGAGSIDELVPAAELVARFVEEAEATLDRMSGLRV